MSALRRGSIALLALSVCAGVALGVACSTFGDDAATADAAPPDATDAPFDTGSALDAGGADASVRFCATANATSPLCDDFEENDGGLSGSWTLSTDAGAIKVAAEPTTPGHFARVEASGDGANVELSFSFAPDLSKTSVTIDFDLRVESGGYDYMELSYVNTADFDAAYFYGVAKLGQSLGREFAPFSGLATVPLDQAWHHVHVDLAQGASGFAQSVTIDRTVIERRTDDLTAFRPLFVQLGIMAAGVGPGQPLGVVDFDNVLVQTTP